MRIQDDGPGAGTFKEARIVSYETMSDVDTGTNPMPTVAQAANGLFIRKSAAADSTARVWRAIADDRMIIMVIFTGDTANVFTGWMWGDFYSHLSADGYRTMLIARSTENSSSMGSAPDMFSLQQNNSFTTALAGHYIQRSRSGVAGAINVQRTNNVGQLSSNATIGTLGSIADPNGEDGGRYLQDFWLHDRSTAPTCSIRGRIRGIYDTPLSISGRSDLDTMGGVADYSGRSFELWKGLGAVGNGMWVETTDSLDTSS